MHEPGCCVHEDFERHPIYVELYHEVKQNEDVERHRSMSKKVGAHADLASSLHHQLIMCSGYRWKTESWHCCRSVGNVSS